MTKEQETLMDAMRIVATTLKTRSDSAKVRATDLADWFISQEIDPNETIDICCFLVGYVSEVKSGGVSPMDVLGMVAAGQTEAKMDKLKGILKDALPEKET